MKWLSWLLDPTVNLVIGLTIITVSTIWTVLSIILTNEPTNVLAMSGGALDLAGLTFIQGSRQLLKIEIETRKENE